MVPGKTNTNAMKISAGGVTSQSARYRSAQDHAPASHASARLRDSAVEASFGVETLAAGGVTVRALDIGRIGDASRRHAIDDRGPQSRTLLRELDPNSAPTTAAFEDRPPAQRHVLVRDDIDNAIRWKDGERLDHVFEQCCDRFAENDAVVADDAVLTYRELDNRANQVARYLREQGIASGDRVGLLFDKTVETYIALLAVMKLNAAYVPFDTGFPTERMRFILADARVTAIVSLSGFGAMLGEFAGRRIFLDLVKSDIDAKSNTRLAADEKTPPADRTCYIIYTSGTTGNPKGVVIEHPSICNFVRVAAELYGFGPGDRVYQGMTIAFDFSVEELWVPLIAGATLVPGKQGTTLIGDDLASFLLAHKVTCLACVPTLLSTIEQDLPDLRVLLVGGEACPHHLVVRWHRPGRTILNSYGPTEATVTATLTELTPDKPVTIGKPLPTYSIVILDPDADKSVARGELGEIGIAGIGLAVGYLNRDDLTRKKFIPDFLDISNNPSRRIYRTGDLGRIDGNDEVEFHGRIDTQVKIRGYRIELVEIESVLMELPQIAQAAVGTYEPEPGMVELVAYYTLKQGVSELPRGEVAALLRSKLPGYMVPTYLEELTVIPMSLSNKAAHKMLPPPKSLRVSGGSGFVGPRTDKEHILARALAEVLKVESVSVEDNFFRDLGAHSLLMARFCAKIRQNPAMSSVSMRDVYLHPTIATLADHLSGAEDETTFVTKPEPVHVPSDLSYVVCGALQLLFYAGYGMLMLWLLATGLAWTYGAIDDPVTLYGRSVTLAVTLFVILTALPIAAKWLLIGRWKEESIPIWSLRYFRFWVVNTLVRSAPMAAFAGTPLYNVYLRLLGARIGRKTVIASRIVPVCTDLFSVGDNTILRKDSMLLGYKAQFNYIHTGTIAIGSNAFVGEASVLDINTTMGDHTQLGHASSLQSGQRIADGKHFHGSPAQETKSNYCPIDRRRCTSVRRALYSAFQLLSVFTLAVPVPVLILNYWYPYFSQYSEGPSLSVVSWTSGLVPLMLLVSSALFFGSLLVGLVGVYLVPRLMYLFLKPNKAYVLYGFHYWAHRTIASFSNSQIYNLLFGDTTAIVHYLRFVGWNLNTVEQTGSNFGTNQKHENPFLCNIGSGTMVSDGLSMINIHMSNSSFQLGEVRIGDRNYIGNDIHYPPDGRTGANCLLGTKTLVPIDGPVRENVGLLGSPSFEIPRMVARDKNISTSLSGEVRRQRIRMKNRHNIVTAAAFLALNWSFFFLTLLVLHAAVLLYPAYGILSLFAAGAFVTAAAIFFYAFIERATLGFKRLEPTIASIYDPYFWSHERHWKLSDSPIVSLFRGTPFKNMISRLLGARVGRKVYDGGASMTERSLVEIGDGANLNEGSILQGHSLEEGAFKSDYVKIGNGCSLGCAAFVHYGVTMGDRVVLDPDSFLMKGEMPDPNTVWRGNPAKMMRSNAGHERACMDLAKAS